MQQKDFNMLPKTGFLIFILLPYAFCFDLGILDTSDSCEDLLSDESENGTYAYLSSASKSVKFYLLTPSNDTIHLNSTNKHLVNTSQPTKIIVHGLGSYEENTWVDTMAYLYHTHGNYNVIAVDWSEISVSTTDLVVDQVDAVGNVIGSFLMEITETHRDYLSEVHLIGSSVGAQVSGAAGEAVGLKGGKVGRITGLDPTQPTDLEILDETDADFVDVIHTGVAYGQRRVGTVDFYVVNGTDGKPICINRNSTNSTINTKNNTSTTPRSKYITTTTMKTPKTTTTTKTLKITTTPKTSKTTTTKTLKSTTTPKTLKGKNLSTTRPKAMPMTHLDTNKTANETCGELLADEYYMMTIEEAQRFEGVSCHDADAVVQKLCDQANSAFMGEHVSRNTSGSYLVLKDGAPGMHSQGMYLLSFSFALMLWYICS